MSSPTYSELLAKAKTALGTVLAGGVVEWSEGGHRTRITEPKQLLDLIKELEQLAADTDDARNPFSVITSEDF